MICQKLCQNDVWVGSLVVRYFFQHHRRTVSSKTICWFLSIYNSCIYSNTLLCMYVLCMYILCMYRYSHRAICNYTAYTYGNWTKIISLISLHQEWCILGLDEGVSDSVQTQVPSGTLQPWWTERINRQAMLRGHARGLGHWGDVQQIWVFRSGIDIVQTDHLGAYICMSTSDFGLSYWC